ncbi:hypothetical protein [Bradyrhizobium elkanii]
MATRKRAPGGGRKPIGAQAKVANFSTRIAQETRDELEALAASRGQSVSHVAEKMLQLGLTVSREKAVEEPLRALCYFLHLLAPHCGYLRKGELKQWNKDPFAFDVFVRVTQLLLEQIRPQGEIAPPEKPLSIPSWSDPQQAAEAAFAVVWHEILTRPPLSPRELREAETQRLDSTIAGREIKPEPEDLMGRFSNRTYAINNARVALGIKMEHEGP